MLSYLLDYLVLFKTTSVYQSPFRNAEICVTTPTTVNISHTLATMVFHFDTTVNFCNHVKRLENVKIVFQRLRVAFEVVQKMS